MNGMNAHIKNLPSPSLLLCDNTRCKFDYVKHAWIFIILVGVRIFLRERLS